MKGGYEMKKKYRISQKGKERIGLILWFIVTSVAVFIATQIYLQRIDDINNNRIVVVPDSECDK